MLASLAKLFAAVALISVSAWVLTNLVERVGLRLRFTPALLGIAVALGADSPEIASAISAVAAGHSDVGIGVVLGSNLFNLAALLGASALVARGRISVGWRGVVLTGGAAMAITSIAAALILGWLSGWVATMLVVFVLVPYVVVSSLHERQLRRLPWPGPAERFVVDAVVNVSRESAEREHDEKRQAATWTDAAGLVPALASVVFGSVVLVDAATTLGERWHVPRTIIGVLVLAALTGIPNVIGALHLARRGRGAALVSEALNSNSLNIAFGLCLPAVTIGLSPVRAPAAIALASLLSMSALAIGLAAFSGGLGKRAGTTLVVLYAAFATTVVIVAF